MTPFLHDGLSVDWKSIGNGEPIVWVHGFLENSSVWDHIVPHFATNFRCVLIDLPGHGSTPAEKQYSIAEVALLVKKLLHTIHCSNPFFIGHSMGGYVGLELKKIIPIKLILLHSNFWEDSLEKKSNRHRVIEAVKTHKKQFVAKAIPNLFYADNQYRCKEIIQKLISGGEGMKSQDMIIATAAMRDRVANAENINEVILIHGTKDRTIPAQRLKTELENLTNPPKIHFIPQCGHMSMFERPEALINILASILIP